MSTFNMRIDMGPEEAVDAINGYFEMVELETEWKCNFCGKRVPKG